MWKYQRLQRTVPKMKEMVLFAFDIEYKRDTGQLIEGCIGDEQNQTFYSSWDEILDGLYYHVKTYGKNTVFIVHAGDIAEFPHIIQYLRNSDKRSETNIDPIYSGETVISMNIKPRYGKMRKIRLIDMFAIFPTGLQKIADKFAPDYPKMKEAVDFSKRDYNPATDREYLRRDVQATVNSYRNISELLMQHFGVQPSLSAAGTAMKAWLASLPKDVKYFRLNPTSEDFCREGYYGAYVHPGKDNELHYNVVSYDITAAYGARMRYKYPVGNPLTTHSFKPDKQGLWRCYVRCIDAGLPIVPYRKRNGVNWLGVAGDSCETTVTTEEILYFRTHGYEVTVLYGLYWKRSEYVFKDFIDKVEIVESINATTKQLAKLMRNSLYGRFGTKKYHEKMIITDNPSGDMIPYCDPRTGKLVEDTYTIEEELDVAYIQPQWAAYITAYQRLAMFDLIYQCGLDNFLGCDTDSVKTFAEVVEERGLPISETEYGKGKIEASFEVYRSHGPKNYVGGKKGSYHMKSKGIPKKYITDDMVEQHLYRDEHTKITVPFVSITRTLPLMKSDGVQPFTIARHRTLSSLHSDKWVLIDGYFKPVGNMV